MNKEDRVLLEELYAERDALLERQREIAEERGYNMAELDIIYVDLEPEDELVRIDDDLYIVNRGIDEIEWAEYVNNIGRSEEAKTREKLYKELRDKYLNDVWNGEYNEISETLDCYEQSVIHYGERVDAGFIFLIDELENYGANDLIEAIYNIVKQ